MVRDIGGLTAMKIIEDICNGNLDPQSLAEHRHHNCRKSEEEIAKVLSIMSEMGPEGFSKFPTAQHFACWLRLAPNHKISGGKTRSNRIPQGSNRLNIALRNAANAIGNLKDFNLAIFFRRIALRKGRTAAINATARKIAVIIWNMVTKKQPYTPKNKYLFLDQKRRIVSKMRKQIKDLGLNPDELGFARANRDDIAREITSDNQTLSLR
ncbi:MAG: transposase [Bacteroidota bacterium]